MLDKVKKNFHFNLKRFSFLAGAAILALGLIIKTSPVSHAGQIPRLIPFSARLMTTDYENVPNGSYTVTFKLYNAETGGTLLWSETKSISVVRGIFTTMLGDTTSFDESMNFAASSLWLTAQIKGDSEMTPRKKVLPAATALMAQGVQYGASLPDSPMAVGELFYDTNASLLYSSDGSSWTVVGGDLQQVTSLGATTTDTLTVGGLTISGSTPLSLASSVIQPSLDGATDLGSASKRFNNIFANALNVTSITSTEQASFTFTPTGSGVNQGTVWVNPTSAPTNSTLLGLSVGGSEKFRVDAEGDVTANSMTINGQSVLTGGGNQTSRLFPEYAGASLVADGTNNSGTLTSDMEEEGNYKYNYYEWSSSETSVLQDYDIYVKWQVPSGFSGFQSGTDNALMVDFATEEAAATNNQVDVYLYKDGSTETSSSTGHYSSVAADWQTAQEGNSPIGFDDSDSVLSSLSAGDVLIIRIVLKSYNDAYARIGAITLNWTN